MGWLDAAFQVAVPMLTGRAQGQVQGVLLNRQLQHEDEDRAAAAEARRAQLAQQALQQQLLQAQIAHTTAEEQRAANPRKPWESQGFGTEEDQLGYLDALTRLEHPERYQKPEASTLTPWGKLGMDETTYYRYLNRSARAEHPERYEKPAPAGSDLPFDPKDPKNHQKFLQAYMMKTGQGHQDPATLQWIPAAPPEQRMADGEVAYQKMLSFTDPNYQAPAGEEHAAPENSDGFTLPGMLEQMFGPQGNVGPVPSRVPDNSGGAATGAGAGANPTFDQARALVKGQDPKKARALLLKAGFNDQEANQILGSQ